MTGSVPHEIRDDIREPGLPRWNRDYFAPCWNRDYFAPCWNRDYFAGR